MDSECDLLNARHTGPIVSPLQDPKRYMYVVRHSGTSLY